MAVVFGDLSRDAERFRVTLAEDVDMVDTIQGLTAALEERPEEDLVIVGADASLATATGIAERYRIERPSLGVVLMRRRVDVQALGEALRAGVREVVPSDDVEALLQASTRSLALSHQLRHLESRPEDARHGRVIMVLGAKGGCGKTTLATNLASALASAGSGRVCLVDLNLEFGDVAIAMQVAPTRTIADALGMQGGLDRDGISSLMMPGGAGLDLLLAPRQPADAEFITSGLVSEIVSLLSEIYDYVVIDSPPAFNERVLACLDIADSYVLLATMDILSLKNLRVTLDTLDALGYPRARWRMVLNRCDSHVGLTAEDVEQVIPVPIEVRLPSSKDVPASLNRGMPLVREKPRHPFSQAVLALARTELSRGAPADVGQSRRRTSRLLRVGR